MALNKDNNIAELQQQRLSLNAKTKTEHFPLLELPDELVLRVLYFAVVTSSKDNPISMYDKKDDRATPPTQPAITKTCQMLRKEGLKMFYKHNVFYTESTHEGTVGLYRWLLDIGPTKRASLGPVWVKWFTTEDDDVEAMPWEWADWVAEMKYLVDRSHVRGPSGPRVELEKVLVRFRRGKLVVGSGGLADCYQLKLGDAESSVGDNWKSCMQMLKARYKQPPSKRRSNRDRDFWVCDEEECQKQDEETEH